MGVGVRKADKAKVRECGEGPSPQSHQTVVTEVLEQSPEELVTEEVKTEIETEAQEKKKVTMDAMRNEMFSGEYSCLLDDGGCGMGDGIAR